MLGKKLSVKLAKLNVLVITHPKHEVCALVGAAPNGYPIRVKETILTAAVTVPPLTNDPNPK